MAWENSGKMDNRRNGRQQKITGLGKEKEPKLSFVSSLLKVISFSLTVRVLCVLERIPASVRPSSRVVWVGGKKTSSVKDKQALAGRSNAASFLRQAAEVKDPGAKWGLCDCGKALQDVVSSGKAGDRNRCPQGNGRVRWRTST